VLVIRQIPDQRSFGDRNESAQPQSPSDGHDPKTVSVPALGTAIRLPLAAFKNPWLRSVSIQC
jgi:hypothetical protein